MKKVIAIGIRIFFFSQIPNHWWCIQTCLANSESYVQQNNSWSYWVGMNECCFLNFVDFVILIGTKIWVHKVLFLLFYLLLHMVYSIHTFTLVKILGFNWCFVLWWNLNRSFFSNFIFTLEHPLPPTHQAVVKVIHWSN